MGSKRKQFSKAKNIILIILIIIIIIIVVVVMILEYSMYQAAQACFPDDCGTPKPLLRSHITEMTTLGC